MLPIRVSVGVGAMAIKWYSAFPKPHNYWSLNIRLFSIIFRTLVRGVFSLCRDWVFIFYTTQPTRPFLQWSWLPLLKRFIKEIRYEIHEKSVKLPQHLMVWGCKSATDVGKTSFLKRSSNATIYPDVLEHSLIARIRDDSGENDLIF